MSVMHEPANPPDWDLYRALREQLTHEDNLVNHRLMWLILSEGLLFTAYGTISTARLHWLAYGFPFFGMAVAGVIGASIYAALAAVLAQPGVVAIPKATGEAHLRENLAAADVALSDADMKAIEQRFPRPDRASPLAMN